MADWERSRKLNGRIWKNINIIYYNHKAQLQLEQFFKVLPPLIWHLILPFASSTTSADEPLATSGVLVLVHMKQYNLTITCPLKASQDLAPSESKNPSRAS
jgi:hypothetical protein